MTTPPPIDNMMAREGPDKRIAVLTIERVQSSDGISETQILIFPSKDIWVGRDENICSPFFRNDIVSRVHFRIYSVIYDDDNMAEFPPLIYCEDRQSTNGTYVNNALIGALASPMSPHLLNDGDIISIRPHWTFHFHQKTPTNERSLDDIQRRELELFEDRYTVSNRLLGSGVYGTVYLANDVVTQKQLACKIVDLRRKALDADASSPSLDRNKGQKVHAYAERARGLAVVRTKLIREIEILSKLSHPNIVTLHKAFLSCHSLYIFNELAAGGDLFSYLQANGPCLPDLHARIISRQVAIAVEFLHSKGIAHRDLKPENILVMRTGIGHRVVLTDFGCAGYIRTSAGRMMSTVGTYDYVAPEVHGTKGKGYTEAIDMWSMGIITLCLLTGDGLISFENLQKLSQSDIAAILGNTSNVHPQWKDVNVYGKDFVNRLLILDPEKRMTANDAVNHDWFQKPVRIAMELDKLYERANLFWPKHPNSIGIIEDLSDVTRLENAQSERRVGARLKSSQARKRIPDTTASPYFGLERYLCPLRKSPISKSYTKRRRLLEEVKETGFSFVVPKINPAHDPTATKQGNTRPLALRQTVSFAEMTPETPQSLQCEELSSTDVRSRIPLAPHRRQPTSAMTKTWNSIPSHLLPPSTSQQRTTLPVGAGTGTGIERVDVDSVIRSNTSRRRTSSLIACPSTREVDANDLFSTAPIEIKADRAAEAAYDELSLDFLPEAGAEPYDASPKRPMTVLSRSYSLSQNNRELYDEATKELPMLTTAKAFAQAIARKRQLKDSQGKE